MSSDTATIHIAESSLRKDARVAGILYALLAAFSVFGIMYADSRFSVAGDAVAMAARIRADEFLFRLGIASALAGQVCQLFLGLAFYRLFRSVNKDQARWLLALVIAMVPVAFLNMLNKFAPTIRDTHRRNFLGPLAPSTGAPRLQVRLLSQDLRRPAGHWLHELSSGQLHRHSLPGRQGICLPDHQLTLGNR
jgi:hypothetical protein